MYRDAQHGSALTRLRAYAPPFRSNRSARRRFASGSPHARLRPDARLLPPVATPSGTDPWLAILRMASPARARLYAAPLLPMPDPLLTPPCVCRAPRPGATRPRRSRSPECRRLPTLRPGASHRRRMLKAIPRLQPHQDTATARRPSVGIAQPRSALRAIAPVACIASSLIVSPVAKCRYVPLSPALHCRLGQRLPDPPRRRAVRRR